MKNVADAEYCSSMEAFEEDANLNEREFTKED